jgi:cysteine desulfurase / selenocysteine lyase
MSDKKVLVKTNARVSAKPAADFDPNVIKKDFPILKRKIGVNDLVYLDNAATAQKPQAVIDALVDYYSNHNANVHRGLHTLSEEATEMYEEARKAVADFIGAAHPEEIIFTKGATESLNRVAIGWALKNLKKDDEIVVTDFEHHSNLIPWQEEARMIGAKVIVLDSDKNGEISLDDLKQKLSGGKVKLVAIAHASNVLGTILPVKEISKLAHEHGALVCVDGAQAIPHLKVNVQSLGCDFYAFSGHKMLGPMGIGILWARKDLLEQMEPYEFGGGMIDVVSYTDATWAQMPEKFEAGTPGVADAIGLHAAIDYLKTIGMENIRQHEIDLNKYALEKLGDIKQVHILGPLDPQKRTGLVTFWVDKVHAHDVASVLNSMGVAVRSGHHCTMPLHKKLGLAATTRASYYLYNTKEDIDKLVEGVNKAIKILG